MDKKPTRKIVPIIICSLVIVLGLAVILYIAAGDGFGSSDFGILEFRILPTQQELQGIEPDARYFIDRLSDKGPEYASNNKYVWCQIKDIKQWSVPDSIIGRFDDKYYVLASNKPDDVLLHSADGSTWKLKNARLGPDDHGRRTMDFTLDKNGEKLIAKITGSNLGHPLCILVDGLAVSAPSIKTRVQKIHCLWPD